eukprot:10929962-Ditylum_brightwellii.AAC.2
MAVMCKDNPVTLAGYAKERKLLEKCGWKWAKNIAKTGDVRGAMQFDKINGNKLWFKAQKKKAGTLREMNTFELMEDGFGWTGYHYVPLIYAWDVKLDGRCRARLVASRMVTIGSPEEDVH